MRIICEKCGKKYQIDPTIIKKKQVKTKCKVCNNIITIVNPEYEPPKPPEPQLLSDDAVTMLPEEKSTQKPSKIKKATSRPSRLKWDGMGLRFKMIALFLIIPVLLVIVASFLYTWQLDTLSSSLIKEGVQTATKTTEDIVTKRTQAVASTVRSYLLTHPELKKALFNYDLTFRRVALQKVGLTGFTTLYEFSGSDGIWRARVHTDPNFVGTDVRNLKKYFGKSYPQFFKILSSATGKKQSSGYFMERNAMGQNRQNFMVCVPVEGTPYVVSANSYPEEFTKSVKSMEVRAKKMATGTKNIIIGVMVGTIILMGLVVTFYAQLLSSRIKDFTAGAERISLGELDVEIGRKMPKDELGDLSVAFIRMQESIRLALERLRKNR